jgi:hypothetical protein
VPTTVVDALVYEVDPRAGFWLADRLRELRSEGRRLRREWRRLKVELEALRMSNPTLFDQLAVVALAAVLEITVSYLKRKER